MRNLVLGIIFRNFQITVLCKNSIYSLSIWVYTLFSVFIFEHTVQNLSLNVVCCFESSLDSFN